MDELVAYQSRNTQILANFERVAGTAVQSWTGIHEVLDELPNHPAPPRGDEFLAAVGAGVGFVTFAFGIDGVTIEIAKYAACFERLFAERGVRVPIHCIGGAFSDSAKMVLVDRWQQHGIPGADGWAKWDGGKWFDQLFRAEMPSGSPRSKELAAEIWKQAVTLARQLLEYVLEHHIGLLIAVNTNSNPGNPALALALVLVTEIANIPVLNSSHDFYWESGKPASQRKPGEQPGPRDHFFRNFDNKPFFRLLERLCPWNGRRWLQFVINSVQMDTLVSHHRFCPTKVFELGTFIEDPFFIPNSRERRNELRQRLGYILGRGERVVRVTGLDEFVAGLDDWMYEQVPVMLGIDGGRLRELDANNVWLLQPTRVVDRKRIERDWHLIGALFGYPPFSAPFEENPNRTLTLHVTGPVQIEHREALDAVLDAYRAVVTSLPPNIGRRIHMVFSVGELGHSAFQPRELKNLTVADLYRVADLVLLPSSTEGRGLPILEAAAVGRPLLCSEYSPREVFARVVGETLAPKERIRFELFPEGAFDTALLQAVTDMLFLPETNADRVRHNRVAMASRFSMRDVTSQFEAAIQALNEATG